MNLKALVGERLAAGLARAGAGDAPAIVGPATRPEFGDYQANGALGAAKRLRQTPRDLAQRTIDASDLDGIASRCTVTGPGFISLTIADQLLADALAAPRIQPLPAVAAARVVLDYSSPNLAKEMQVHHLRSTIIGDAIARVLEALGCEVIRQNHVGDWGAQFGRLVAHLNDCEADSEDLADLERFYRQASARVDADPAFAARARQVVAALHSGDAEVLARWRRYVDVSLSHCRAVYDALGVGLGDADVRGESAYHDDLADVVADLDAKGLIAESDGARCVFLDEFKGKDGSPLPVIVQKSDGAYLYHTTDLAALRYRVETLGADRVLYIVDARQSLHFRQLFALAKAAGYGEEVSFEHHPFGTMLGTDGRPFKTREGGGARLLSLLEEAALRARRVVEEKNPTLDAQTMARIAHTVGVGAVKYADLAKNRTSDYVFSWDAMLSLDGNTAPYLQYAYARIQSLFAKAGMPLEAAEPVPGPLETPEEHALALQLARFQETLEQVAATVMPHHLCSYLYDLAAAFMRFYERCPVLDSDLRASRLLLSRRTAETLSTGLGLLGIDTVDRM